MGRAKKSLARFQLPGTGTSLSVSLSLSPCNCVCHFLQIIAQCQWDHRARLISFVNNSSGAIPAQEVILSQSNVSTSKHNTNNGTHLLRSIGILTNNQRPVNCPLSAAAATAVVPLAMFFPSPLTLAKGFICLQHFSHHSSSDFYLFLLLLSVPVCLSEAQLPPTTAEEDLLKSDS